MKSSIQISAVILITKVCEKIIFVPVPGGTLFSMTLSLHETIEEIMLLSKYNMTCIRRCNVTAGSVHFTIRHFSSAKVSDRDLLAGYACASGYFKAILNMLLKPAKTTQYLSLKQSRVIPNGVISQLWPYYCLQNPLLHRYNIDGTDLIAGAKHSFKAINEAVSTMQQPQLRDFLCSVSPENYLDLPHSFLNQNFKYPKLLRLRNYMTPNIRLKNIITKIVGDGPGEFPYLDTVYHLDNPDCEESSEEAQELRYERDFASFPTGAVLAYMDVQCEGLEEKQRLKNELMVQIEEHNLSLEGTKLAAEKLIFAEKTVLSFRACISGEVPLEWMLVDINGPRGIQYAQIW